MNHVYRIVWNQAAACWQAVAETAKRQGKHSLGKTRARTSLGNQSGFVPKVLIAALLTAWGVTAALAGPQGGQLVAGNATIQQSGAITTINQSTAKAAIDWNSFSIGKGESVRFKQPTSSSITLNRVTGLESRQILGNLSANGQVFILNPNGVLFGKDAQVNVGGLVASTRQMSDADFMAGNYKLTGTGSGSVVNQGNIQVAEGGTLALIAPVVQNTGTLSAPQGSILLAAADAVTVTLLDGSLVGYTLDKGSLAALVDNGGLIQAPGGHVILTAKGLDELSRAVVNHSGIIEAQTVSTRNGIVELLGDMQAGQV
jgi:filamentous hemagglutinin family protein